MPRKSTKHYWIDRIAEANERNLKLSKREYTRLLKELYAEQSEKLRQSIANVFMKMLADSEDGKVYMNDLYRTNAYNELLNEFNERARALGSQQVKITEEALVKAYEMAAKVVSENVPPESISTSFNVPSAVDPKQAIHQVWCLDGREFSDRIWLNKKALVADLSRTMADFVARGDSPYKIAQGITDRLKVDEYCAYRLARTETAHAQVKGQIDKYREYGFTHGIYRSVDPCGECGELDGREFTLSELEHMIPKHPNCECSFDIKV